MWRHQPKPTNKPMSDKTPKEIVLANGQTTLCSKDLFDADKKLRQLINALRQQEQHYQGSVDEARMLLAHPPEDHREPPQILKCKLAMRRALFGQSLTNTRWLLSNKRPWMRGSNPKCARCGQPVATNAPQMRTTEDLSANFYHQKCWDEYCHEQASNNCPVTNQTPPSEN